MARRSHPARSLAVQLLRQLEQGERTAFSNRLLDDAFTKHPQGKRLDRRDRALVTTLVYGVLRHRARLDALIDAVAHNPARLRGRIRVILRLAALELRELDRPPHVAISEAQSATRKLDPTGKLGRVTQALLSEIVRRGEELDAAHEQLAPAKALYRRWSIPRWLARRWVDPAAGLGPERALRRAQALSRPCSIDLRVDLSRTSRERVLEALREDAEDPARAGKLRCEAPESLTLADGRVVPQPQLLRVISGGQLAKHPLHTRGLFSIQALGSQQAVRVLDPQPGERVLDVCAGLGTKTLQLAEHMQRRGVLVATDTNAARLSAHAELGSRGGLVDATSSGALTVIRALADMATPEPVPEVDAGDEGYDRVLLDAPCTGLGNLARHPEARWTTRPEDIEECAALQRRLLKRCWTRVRPGGRLVYAVCSLEPEEGPTLVEEFVRARASSATLLEQQRWTPETHACDGFYLAALTRAH